MRTDTFNNIFNNQAKFIKWNMPNVAECRTRLLVEYNNMHAVQIVSQSAQLLLKLPMTLLLRLAAAKQYHKLLLVE